jgi:predicted AAA+ superfamily ATPase
MVKSPKLYFLDSGLLCFLLRIRKPEELNAHAARGAVFETFVVSEMLKSFYHQGLQPDVYFWRDVSGHEVDIILEAGPEPVPIEVKSGETIAGDFFKGLDFWCTLSGQKNARSALVYGGDDSRKQRGVCVYSWRDWM